jgi:ribosomal protein S18 acetylase RimI-like enzyme
MSKIVFRTIQTTEWREYRDLRLRALKDSPDAFGSTFERERQFTDQDWQDRFLRYTANISLPLVAVADQHFSGLAWGRIDPDDGQIAHLYQMWVAPELRGQGLGRRLADMILNWAREQGATIMALEVTCGNQPAERLYESFGFRITGEPVPIRPGTDLLERSMMLKL